MDIVGGWTFSFKRKIIRFLWQKCLLYSELCDYSYFHFFQNEAICVCSGCFLALWDNKQGTFPYVEERHFHLNAHHQQLDLSRWSSSSQPSLSSSSLPHCHHRGMQSHPVIFILSDCCIVIVIVSVLILFWPLWFVFVAFLIHLWPFWFFDLLSLLAPLAVLL